MSVRQYCSLSDGVGFAAQQRRQIPVSPVRQASIIPADIYVLALRKQMTCHKR